MLAFLSTPDHECNIGFKIYNLHVMLVTALLTPMTTTGSARPTDRQCCGAMLASSGGDSPLDIMCLVDSSKELKQTQELTRVMSHLPK